MSIYDNESPQGDKRTILAIVLSVVVISASFIIQGILWPAPTQTAQATTPVPAQGPSGGASTAAPDASASVPPVAVAAVSTDIPANASVTVPSSERTYTITTDLFEAVLSNRGGDLVSLKLRKHNDADGAVDLVVPDSSGKGGLTLAFGANGASPVSDLMNAVQIGDTISFFRTYYVAAPGKADRQAVTLKKTYSFKDGDYMFGMAVSLENEANEYLPLNFDGYAYTLSFGPQIGPKLTVKPGSGYSDTRTFIRQVAGKKKTENPKPGTPLVLKDQPTWISLTGKYFSFIAYPEMPVFRTTLYSAQDPVLFQRDGFSIARPAIQASRQTDKYYFYFGPKTTTELKKYTYETDNAFKLKALDFEQVLDGAGIFRWLWLENGIKFILNLFYALVPNFGVAIILVTILVKALLFPLTKKGSLSSARMQELQPKMKELQEKYKGNPQKLNMEMAAFYKREGFNPMSGCLPLLIQMPIFLAMYNLFNTHFDLRGASFIPGWISDLSVPEAIVTFGRVNLLIWQVDALRILPIIYVVSQLLYGKYTQMSTPTQSATQMKIMMYGMPIFFFFILYNAPSGLLVYWIVSNILTIAQQVVINNLLKQRKLALAAAAPAAPARVLPPNKGGGKKKRR